MISQDTHLLQGRAYLLVAEDYGAGIEDGQDMRKICSTLLNYLSLGEKFSIIKVLSFMNYSNGLFVF